MELELEQHIQEYNTNEDKKRIINEKILKAKKEQEYFISLFPRSEVRNIDILDYVQGKSEGWNKTFSYLIEHGSRTFGMIGEGFAIKHGVYMNKKTQVIEFRPEHFKSHTEAYDNTINVIANCLDHAKNFIKTKDWKNFSDHITELIESKKETPGIGVISKIISMYYPDEFIRMWSHKWLNNTLDVFQIKREDLPEGKNLGMFYEKMKRVMEMKNSHPIMKEWSNEYFSYSIGTYLANKFTTKKTKSKLLDFLKFNMNMKQNYQPIVIKMLLENPNHTITIQDIRKKFGELNFDRGNFVSSTGKAMGNSAIDAVKESKVKKYVKFPEGTSDGNVTLIKKTYDESTKDECLKICGQKIAKWHIEKIAKDGFTIWGTQPGSRDSNYEYLDEFLETSSIGCGWSGFGDLSKFPQKSDAWQFIRNEYPEEVNKQTATTFSHDIKKKDIIVLTKGQSEIIDFGIVTSDYEYIPKEDEESYSHRRRVVWLKRGSIKKEDLPDGLMSGMVATINPMRKQENIDSMIDVLLEEEIGTKKDLTYKEDESDTVSMDNYDRALTWKPNLILYGPPGTGKTYHANKIAKRITSSNKSNRSFEHILARTLQQPADIYQISDGEYKNFVIDSIKNEAEEQDYTFTEINTYGHYSLEKNGQKIHIDIHYSASTTKDPDDLYVGISQTNVDFLKQVPEDNRFIIIVNHSRKNFVVLPYSIEQKQKAEFSNSTDGNWDPTGVNAHSFHIIIDADKVNFKRAGYDCKKFMRNINMIFSNETIMAVTFHPSFSYEDFIEGFRPDVDPSTSSQYVLEDGIFKTACNIAKTDRDKKIVIIIDEINRGNIPKIFGELISLIENDKRGPNNTLKLVYSKENFFVPANLYIIGTMNTADKSLVQMDEALRRRFGFEELMPDADLLDERPASKYKEILVKLNDKIVAGDRMRQYRDKQIGHSYFWNIENDHDLRFVIKYQIIPLLQDYFYDDYEEIKTVLGNKIIGKDNRPTGLLDKGRETELKDVLLKFLNKSGTDSDEEQEESEPEEEQEENAE